MENKWLLFCGVLLPGFVQNSMQYFCEILIFFKRQVTLHVAAIQ